MLKRIANRRVAVLTGWALDPGARFRYQCDAAFPLTDHADYPDFVRYVELVQPERVLHSARVRRANLPAICASAGSRLGR